MQPTDLVHRELAARLGLPVHGSEIWRQQDERALRLVKAVKPFHPNLFIRSGDENPSHLVESHVRDPATGVRQDGLRHVERACRRERSRSRTYQIAAAAAAPTAGVLEEVKELNWAFPVFR